MFNCLKIKDLLLFGKAGRKGENMVNIYCEKEQTHKASAQRAKEGILLNTDVAQICTVFRMLADPTRMKILMALMEGEMCVYHLAELTDSTVSGTSHQLRTLRDNNLVHAKRYGRNVEYSIADGHVREIISLAIAHLTCEEA